MSQILLPKLIAHRGASAHAPENTLIAMKKAHSLGANWVEFDVTLTLDGVCVIFHDDDVGRTTNGQGAITNIAYAELQNFDAGSWFDEQYAHTRIPTLEDCLLTLIEYGMGMNIELKPPPGREQELVVKTVTLVEDIWPEQLPAPLFSSFNLEALTILRRMRPEVIIGGLMNTWYAPWQALADALQCVSIHLNNEYIEAWQVEEIKITGRHVLCYTVNERARAQELFTWGVDAIFSDHADLLVPAEITSE